MMKSSFLLSRAILPLWSLLVCSCGEEKQGNTVASWLQDLHSDNEQIEDKANEHMRALQLAMSAIQSDYDEIKNRVGHIGLQAVGMGKDLEPVARALYVKSMHMMARCLEICEAVLDGTMDEETASRELEVLVNELMDVRALCESIMDTPLYKGAIALTNMSQMDEELQRQLFGRPDTLIRLYEETTHPKLKSTIKRLLDAASESATGGDASHDKGGSYFTR